MKSLAQLAFLCCLLSVAHASDETLQDAAPATQVDAPAPGRTVVHASMDPKHPFLLGDDYYPRESKRLFEEGSCAVNAFADAEGWVTAVQVVTSTGFPRLDAACIKAFDNARVIPGSINGVPTAAWEVFRFNWSLSSARRPKIPLPAEGSRPRMSTAPHVGDQYYPAEARAKHQQGSCVVVAKIGADGEARDPSIVKSTGAPSLDRACLGALLLASYTPQTRDGLALDTPVEFAFFWRLK